MKRSTPQINLSYIEKLVSAVACRDTFVLKKKTQYILLSKSVNPKGLMWKNNVFS